MSSAARAQAEGSGGSGQGRRTPGLGPGRSPSPAAALTRATRLPAARRNLLRYGSQGRLLLSLSTDRMRGN